jgi:hypothetical protein
VTADNLHFGVHDPQLTAVHQSIGKGNASHSPVASPTYVPFLISALPAYGGSEAIHNGYCIYFVSHHLSRGNHRE